jgi:hypothetical protein
MPFDVPHFDAVKVTQRLFAGNEKPASGPVKPIRILSCDEQRLDGITGVRTADAVDLVAVEGKLLQAALEFPKIESLVVGRRYGRLCSRSFDCSSRHWRFRLDCLGDGGIQLHELPENGHGAQVRAVSGSIVEVPIEI